MKTPLWSYEGNEAHKIEIEHCDGDTLWCKCGAAANDHYFTNLEGDERAQVVITFTRTLSIDVVSRKNAGGYSKALPVALDEYDLGKVRGLVSSGPIACKVEL